jgi:hypothetical protein
MDGDSTQGSTVALVAGAVCLLIGFVILGVLVGLIPAGEVSYQAPPMILFALSLGLILFGLLLGIPPKAPSWLRAGLGLALIGMLAVVCNWSAFAPDVVYRSSQQIGPLSGEAESPVGGRIVFGMAALAVDLLLIGSILWTLKAAIDKIRR